MPRLLFATGQNSPTQVPSHFGVVTAGSTIKAWHAEHGSIHINQSRFTLAKPTAIAITSTHKPLATPTIPNQPILAVGTDYGLIHLINLNNGELIQTLRQMDDPTNPSHARSLPVRDLLWSKDGSVLYSVSPKFVFVWHVGNRVAQHQRLNIFGALVDATNTQIGMDATTKRLVDTSHDHLRRIALNHNEDKLILGSNNSIYVYDLLTKTILTKYYGFLGKVQTITTDTAPRNYTAQYHHELVQKQFNREDFDRGGKTEFFIVCASYDDTNATVYQYPPIASKFDLLLNKKTQKQNQAKTSQFIISDTPTATCTLPSAALSLQLSVIYPTLGLYVPQNIHKLSDEDLQVFTAIDAEQRPELVLTAALTNGAVSMFNIPSGTAGSSTKSIQATMVDGDVKGKKKGTGKESAKTKPTTFTLTTLPVTKSRITIHDPTITNNHQTLAKESSSTSALTAAKSLKKGAVGNHADKSLQIKVFQEGSINNAFLLNLGQVCVVRNSTLRPKAETVQLLYPTSQPHWAKYIHLPAPRTQPELKSNRFYESTIVIGSILKDLIAAWKSTIVVDKLRLTSNADIQLSLVQDKLLFDAVKSTMKKGKDGSNILLSGTKQGSLMRMGARDDGQEQGLEDPILQKAKRQRLLSHSAKINSSLRNILEDNQDKIGLLALAPALNNNLSFEQMNPYEAFPALQGTLCGILVQGLKSGDDTSIEYCLKQGVQGLNSQYGWGTLTRMLNNPETLRNLRSKSNESSKSKSDLTMDGSDDKARATNDLGIAIVGAQWTQVQPKNVALGKTIIQTVHLLPTAFIIPFITVLTDKLALAPLRAFELLPWIHVLLRLHSTFLLSTPAVNEKLNQISLLLRQRTTTMDAAVQLKGRLEVIMTQFNAATNAATGSQTTNKNDNGFIPLNVYSEDQHGNDDFHSLEDIEDSYNTKPNSRKRKGAPEDNFAASGLSLDALDDEDYEDEDEFGEMDDWMGMGEDGFGDDMMFGEGEDGDLGDFGDFDDDDMDDDDDEAADMDDDMFDASDEFELSDDDL